MSTQFKDGARVKVTHRTSAGIKQFKALAHHCPNAAQPEDERLTAYRLEPIGDTGSLGFTSEDERANLPLVTQRLPERIYNRFGVIDVQVSR